MKTIRDFDVFEKRVLVRCDFNVPLSKEGDILDDFRIRKTIPTIKYLVEKQAKVILISHLGDPQKEISGNFSVLSDKLKKYSLKPIVGRLKELLGQEVVFLPDCIGRDTQAEALKMAPREIALLENLRFYKGEEEADPEFAKELAGLGEIFINDAFGTCHRPHSSIALLPKYLPSGAGLLLENEIEILSGLLKNPQKPLIAIIGGKKVETKSALIERILDIADYVILDGLLKREIDEKKMDFGNPGKIIWPADVVLRDFKILKFEEAKGIDIPDIGPEAIKIFKKKIIEAKTIFWNGPFGYIEDEKFSKGTEEIARAVAASSAFTIAGGGETVEFIKKLGLEDKFNHISTGGGAMLAFVSGEELPGLKALQE